MMVNRYEDPAVTRTERTGYAEPEPCVVGQCAICGQDIYEYELRGLYGTKIIHAECADDEWGQLTVSEKLDRLGYTAAVIYL